MIGRSILVGLLVASSPVYAQTVRHVPAGGNLQTVINAAQPGDTITLQPGATYVGNFVLPAKSGTQFITIRSAAADANLPAAGTRITPAASAWLPKLRSPNNEPVLRTAAGAHHYRLLFLEFLANALGASTVVALGDGSTAQNTLAKVPYALEVDRVYIHGDPVLGQKRGIGLNSASTTIVNSYISEIKAVGQDSQAIGGWNGPGPYVIANNYLEAAGENIMFGGGDPAIPNLIPSDIIITGNHLFKPLSWRNTAWTVKNLFELKTGQRVVLDRNLLENNWLAAQQGSAIVLKSVNQDGGAPWTVVQDVLITNNIVRNVSSAVNIRSRDTHYPAIDANNITVRNNLFTNVSGSAFGGTGRLALVNGGSDIVFDHNTVINDGSSTLFGDGDPVHGFVFTNNVLLDNGLGIKTSGVSEGQATLTAFFPGAVVTGNIIANANGSVYPVNNFYPALANVGFVAYASGNYRLAETSSYKRAAAGKDPGVDFSILEAVPDGGTPHAGTGAPPAQIAPPPGGSTPTVENTHTPHRITANVAASTVTISWSAPSTGGVLQYVIEAGSAPGAANIVRLVTANNSTSLIAQAVPNGIYYVRIRAITAAGLSAPSGDISFVVGHASGCVSAPFAPSELAASVRGGTVQLTWGATSGPCGATHYVVQAGSASGFSNLAQISVAGQTLLASAPPGDYYVRVIAANAAGVSAASNEIVVTVRP